ncbi:hybrid sensor histidine kinase/response regulator [Chitinophaga sp.]|uniref:hybrid sensor histidine kinase/response regulator n=1 Tax=Chitinophaga sp. TaxID=1869181 RepID=UPI002F9434F2
MESNNYTLAYSLKEILLAPLFAGTRGLEKMEDKRPVVIVNGVALLMIAIVLAVGSYFYVLKNSIFFLIGVPFEVICFSTVITLNYGRKYFQATLFMLVINVIFVTYWSIVLGAGISTEMLMVFISLIIFHLSGSLFLHTERTLIYGCLAVSVLLMIGVVVNAFYHLIKPLNLNPGIAVTMRGYTTTALFLLIVFVMSTYVSQIKYLLISERKLKEISERKSVFLRETFHELRTPLNAIFGNAQLFQRRKDKYSDSEKLEIEQLFASCYLARNLINNVLDMSRIDSGKFYSIIKEPVNLKECIAHCVTMNSYIAGSRGITIKNSFDYELPLIINSDQLILTKIINNVLSNAVKFAPGYSNVVFSAMKKEEQIIFSIQNKGVIDRKISNNIFDPFVSGRNQFVEGTGLGLGITKHLVELFAGAIRLETDEAKQHTIIVIEIPLEVSSGKIAEQEPVQFRKNCFAGSTVVIIEDELLSATLLTKILTEMGIRPILCTDWEIASNTIKLEKPDAIISDLNLPGMCGKELLQHLRNNTEIKGIPILIVSGDAFSSVKEEMLAAGADAFISKPVHFKELYTELSKHLPQYHALL